MSRIEKKLRAARRELNLEIKKEQWPKKKGVTVAAAHPSVNQTLRPFDRTKGVTLW